MTLSWRERQLAGTATSHYSQAERSAGYRGGGGASSHSSGEIWTSTQLVGQQIIQIRA